MKKKLIFTNIFIIICIIIYILNVFVVSPETGSMSKTAIEILEKDAEVTDESILIFKILGTWGGNVNDTLGFGVSEFARGEIWRPFTALLTHSQILHLITNMLALFILGNKIEEKYGTLKTGAIFIIAGAITNILGAFVYFNLLGNEKSMIYGASSGILILLGIMLAIGLYEKDYWKTNLKKKEKIYLIVYFVFTTFLIKSVFTLLDHMTGLILGLIIGIFILNKSVKDKK